MINPNTIEKQNENTTLIQHKINSKNKTKRKTFFIPTWEPSRSILWLNFIMAHSSV